MRDIGPRLYHLENLDLCATDGRADAVELREHNLWARIHPFRLALASGVGDIGARRVHSYLGSITCHVLSASGHYTPWMLDWIELRGH